MKNLQSRPKIAKFPIFPGPIYVPYGHRPNLFLAYENTKVMKYIIPENIFDIANIWSLANGLLQGGF